MGQMLMEILSKLLEHNKIKSNKQDRSIAGNTSGQKYPS